MKRILAGTLVLSACVAGGLPSAEGPPAPAAASSQRQIVYQADGNLWLASPDGTDRTNLTNDEVESPGFPQWSPNREYVVFACHFGDAQDICSMSMMGNEVQRVTNTEAIDFGPDWSPSGNRLAFVSEIRGVHKIVVAESDGSQRRVLKKTPGASALGWGSNSRIVFSGNALDGGDIYSIRPNGSGLQRLTKRDQGFEHSPQWSPDGNWIVFTRGVGDTYEDVFKMRADGSRVRRLTTDCCLKHGPTWSPDGEKILFSDSGGLYVISADGSGRRFVPGTENAFGSDWS